MTNLVELNEWRTIFTQRARRLANKNLPLMMKNIIHLITMFPD